MSVLSMRAVTVSSSASRASLPALRRPSLSLALRARRTKCSAFVSPQEHAPQKKSRRVKAVSLEAAPASSSSREASTVELDYNEVAAALENIYKLSPAEVSDVEEEDGGKGRRRGRRRSKRVEEGGEEEKDGILGGVVRNRKRRARRLSLEKRIVLRRRKKEGAAAESGEYAERLVREYSAAAKLESLDWKRMKIPPVLSSAEHNRLFKLMQPMKKIFEVKENMRKDLNQEPTDSDLAAAVNMTVPQIRRHIEVGQAARNKLIKHNLRLVLFVINKYYQEIASGQKFQDLCQAGANGLITAIDKFEPKRGFRLSTYALFWIRHSITRSMTQSSFQRVSFGIESVRQEIQKAKLELSVELGRSPTEEEVIAKVGISPERYHDVMKATKPVFSLNARHNITQEEFINALTDIDGVGGDKHRHPALLRLALDDVLDSLKPKESLVIRQRYGLDGKGDRTLGEIAGNLNISREMVRKHELKALMKLKHPARVDYLRRYV